MSHCTNLRYVRHAVNQGRSQTRNTGIRESQGWIVIFLDDDNVPDPQFVQAHMDYHMSVGDRHIAVMGNVSFDSAIVERSNFARFMQSRYLGHRSPVSRRRLNYSDLPGNYLGSGNCSVRREDLVAAGMFDTRFRYYGGEDEDLGFALKRLGLSIVFGERARTVHYDEITLSRYKTKYVETGREGLRAMVEKNPEYATRTNVGWLLPADLRHDSIARVFGKIVLQGLSRTPLPPLLEKWAIATDRYSWVFVPFLYHYLLAVWVLHGYRSPVGGIGVLQSGEGRQGGS